MLPLENITVGALLRRTAARFPERDALLFRGMRLRPKPWLCSMLFSASAL